MNSNMIEKIKNNCIQMLNQRGYSIINDKNIILNYKEDNIDDNKTQNIENINNIYDNILALKKNGDNIIVFFIKNTSFDTKGIREILSIMNSNKINHSVVVYKEKVTPVTLGIIEQIEDMKIELFSENELQFNITKHRLQPIFEKISLEDSKNIINKLGTRLPILKKDGPISRFYDYDRGDVIRVIRKNGYITYRIVK